MLFILPYRPLLDLSRNRFASVIARSEATKQSSQKLLNCGNLGLLRHFVPRNDGGCGNFWTSILQGAKRGRNPAILLVLFIMLAFSACSGGDDPWAPPELLVPVSARVDTAFVTRGDVAAVSTYVGITRTSSQSLSFEGVAGNFASFYVSIGDNVVQGQILARLNSENLERDIANQEAYIARIQQENTLHSQGMRLEVSRLTREGAPRNDISRAALELDVASERYALRLSHANARLAELNASLAQMEILAPNDGVITYLPQFERGQWVGSFMPVVFISFDDYVFVEYMGNALQQPGRAVRVIGHIHGEVYDLIHSPLTPARQLYYQSRISANPIRFVAQEGSLPLGAYVSLDVYSQWVPDVLRIPSNALFYVPGQGFHVYKIVAGALTQIALAIGARTETFTEVISGLQEGDEVFVRP